MSKTLIDSLTPEQEKDKLRIKEYYRSVGCCVEPADWGKAKEQISTLYGLINLPTPPFVHVSSPNEANILVSFLSTEESKLRKLDVAYIESCIDNGIKIDFSKIDMNTVTKSHCSIYFYGQFDVPWICFYKFCIDVVGEDKVEKKDVELLEVWNKLSHSCCSWYPFENLCIISDRPRELHFDENYELHNETGPSVRFEDGFSLYNIHGVIVPEWVVLHPDQITVEKILEEQNAEVRRIMIDRFGMENYLEETGAKKIDEDVSRIDNNNPEVMVLRVLYEDKEGRKFLCGTDGSTTRTYFMRVPNEVKTCKEAGDALAGFREDDIIATS